jgi:hypothetical protein
MSEHKDPSRTWLVFFFVCFIVSVVGIGVWASMCYNVNAPEPAATGGHGG